MLKTDYAVAFARSYGRSRDALYDCAILYFKGVQEAVKNGTLMSQAIRDFQTRVGNTKGADFKITPSGWRLLWGVGAREIAPCFLGACYQSHGLAFAQLRVPLKEQERVFKNGLDIWDADGHYYRYTIDRIQIKHIWQAYMPGGVKRTREEQIKWAKAHQSFRYVKMDRETIRQLLLDGMFTPAELRAIAKQLEEKEQE